MNYKFIFILLIVALVLFVVHKIMSKFKLPKLGQMVFIDGGVKSGKSTLAVAFLRSQYRLCIRRWKIKCFLCEILNREKPEEPLIYSNIPLSIPFVPLTEELILRQKRFRFGSVVYINEASLLADSQLIKDADLNARLLLFSKLIGHELHAGTSCLILDSQTVADVHYSFKRSLAETFYVHHLVKWIPFFLVAYIREERYRDDGTVINTYTNDVEDSMKKVIIKKSTWKIFDSCCFSIFTDDLECEDNVIRTKDLKAKTIVSFRDWSKYITSKFTKNKHKKIEYNKLELNNDEKKND